MERLTSALAPDRTTNHERIPPTMENLSPYRLPSSPARTAPKIRLCAMVSEEDIGTGRMSLPGNNQLQLANATKCHSKNAFDTIFSPDVDVNEVCGEVAGDLMTPFFAGVDCSLVAFGAKSRRKEEVLYGCGPSTSGVLQHTVETIFRTMDDNRRQRPDLRYQLRLSAVLYSQRENSLIDQLSPFNSQVRSGRCVGVREEAGAVGLENESEVRVETPEQALFYLSTVADHRIVEDEETYRTNHLFVFFNLYAFRFGGVELEGGRRRFCIVDLGIGERNSQKGEVTMPVLGSFLLALVQGQKNIPSKEKTLCQLLRICLSGARHTTLISSFADKNDDNENILQLVSKLSRARKPKRPGKSSDCGSSANSGRRSELESGSEFSQAETVIFVGSSPHSLQKNSGVPPRSPSNCSKLTAASGSSGTYTCAGSIPPVLKGHTPFLSSSLKVYDDLCSPPGCSDSPGPSGVLPDSNTTKSTMIAFGGRSNQKREDMGITIASSKHSKSKGLSSATFKSAEYPTRKNNLDEDKKKAILQWMDTCNDYEFYNGESDLLDENQAKECVILSHPLEDIIEQDEESMRSSLRSRQDSHPLRILSREGLDKFDGTENEKPDSDEDALEKAMAASVSSIKSHAILAKLSSELLPKDISLTTTGTGSEMDMFRRASHLEEYAIERIKELEEEKKKKRLGLNCCQSSMVSSGSTVDWNAVEKRRLLEKQRQEEEQRKDDLRYRREKLKFEELELRKERFAIDKELEKPSLPTSIARQISLQLQTFALGNKGKSRLPSDSLPSTPTISHRKVAPPCRTPSLTNVFNGVDQTHTSSLPRPTKTSESHSRKHSKSRAEKKERRNSESKEEISAVSIRSPYHKITEARAASSGRGSDDQSSLKGDSKKRQSYSASSGYESASGDYHTYYGLKESRLDRIRFVDKRLCLGREADALRDTQRRLRNELQEAKQNIGQTDDTRVYCGEKRLAGISQATLVDTLVQENKILEKRLVACRNHTMVVTALV